MAEPLILILSPTVRFSIAVYLRLSLLPSKPLPAIFDALTSKVSLPESPFIVMTCLVAVTVPVVTLFVPSPVSIVIFSLVCAFASVISSLPAVPFMLSILVFAVTVVMVPDSTFLKPLKSIFVSSAAFVPLKSYLSCKPSPISPETVTVFRSLPTVATFVATVTFSVSFCPEALTVALKSLEFASCLAMRLICPAVPLVASSAVCVEPL